MFFKDFRKFETTLAGRPLVVETGKMAQLAGGSCLIRYGETEVLCTATMADKPREGVDFFPLSVDFEEKLYSVGRIPGSFQRREGKASEKATLASRVIDRPIRPLFPKDMRNDVGVVATVMSVDPDCSPEITAMIGVSVAISISAIPWDGPISGVSVGLIDGEYVINPTEEQRKVSQMAVTVASTKDLVAMIEAGANEVSNEDMFDGIMYAHKVNQEIVKFIEDIRAEVGKEKNDFPSNDPAPEMFEAIKEFAIDDVKVALDTDDKRIRDEALRTPLFTRSSTRFIPTISQRSTIACISFRSSSFAAGFLTRASVLTDVESTRFVRLTQRLTSSVVFTVQVCSLAVRLSVFQSQRSDL